MYDIYAPFIIIYYGENKMLSDNGFETSLFLKRVATLEGRDSFWEWQKDLKPCSSNKWVGQQS